MKLLALLALCLASIAFVGVIAFAALGMPGACIGSACTVAWSILVACREADAARNDQDWIDSHRHPRL